MSEFFAGYFVGAIVTAITGAVFQYLLNRDKR